MYKLITCDLDETLLDDNGEMCKRNKDAILAAKAKGVKFVPATGRGFNDIQDLLDELNLKDQDDEYVISFNGGSITENKDNKILHFKGLDFSRAKELFELGKKLGICIHFYTEDVCYLYHPDQDELDFIASRLNCQIIDDDFDINILSDQQIPKVIFENTDMSYLKDIAKKYQKDFSDLDVSYSSNRYLELNPKGVNKGAGLEWLANKLNIDLSQTIAIGDNLNDLSMIKKAGLGVGIKNAANDILNDVDYITSADNNEGGVGEAIERFVL